MADNGNITLTREEWEAFNRRINTPDPERMRRAEAFLHEYDGIVSVNREGDRTEIDIPWLDNDTMLALLGVSEKKEALNLQHFGSEATASMKSAPLPSAKYRMSNRTTDSYSIQFEIGTIVLAA